MVVPNDLEMMKYSPPPSTYRAVMGSRMNEVMKVLTIIATIFIPLTFIAGIYGMNFEYMPELSVRWGYFAAVGVMIALGVGLALFFKGSEVVLVVLATDQSAGRRDQEGAR
jgi:Mg2+ and Co2+ transporter CorA